MTEQNPPTDAAAGAEPTVPLVPAQGYSQPDVPPLEPTTVDPFGSAGSGGSYPDFSYDGPTLNEPTPASAIDPNPFPAASNYTQPTVPAAASYADPYRPAQAAYGDPAPIRDPYPAVAAPPAQYQQYPVAQTPLHDPVAYDYGYAAMGAPVADHPNAIPSLILGIVGFFFLPILCPVGWVLAAKGRREVASNPGRWANGGTLTAAWIISIIGTALWGLFVLFFFGIFAIALVGVGLS